jgi:hypothetical protein
MNTNSQKTISLSIFKIALSLLVLFFAQSAASAQTMPNSVECAKEGERCQFIGTSDVSYGAGGKWTTKTLKGGFTCGVATFGGDPAPNILKTCRLVPTKCADEGGNCAFSGVRTVKYGANGIWATKTAKDGLVCGVAAFGRDPVPNVRKQCFLSTPDEKRINELTWLGSHNAIASTHYGYFIQASQRDSVTAQLDRGARLLEMDVVNDTPPGYPNGIYVCHCGMAPHSFSVPEVNRMLGQKDFPFQLPGWTHGTPYRQFSSILKEVDQWLLANPTEIVMVLIQKNSGTGAQLDAEINLAGLKTGIYKKIDGELWATKSELVKINKRLVFLGEKITGSNYVNGDSTVWGGMVAPSEFGSNEYLKYKAGSDDLKMLGIGFFHMAMTTELTSLSYNNYAFLNAKKTEWTAGGIKRLPSYVQVNNVHIGDPLRFVNDINGADYLISSKTETVGSNSEDSWQIRFQNEAPFNAGLEVVYFEDQVIGGNTMAMPRGLSTGVTNVLVGTVRMINIPKKTSPGKPIFVSVKLYSTQAFELWTGEIPADFVGSPVPCFRATGILTSPKGGRCE